MKNLKYAGSFFLCIAVLIAFSFQVRGQKTESIESSRVIVFPDIPGYKTLVCDFHQHTVFSDGEVWPSIRIQEALADGLDAVSITDHLEYQPHNDDIPHPDRNRVFQIAREEAEGKDLIIINGSEVTRDMPPGHSNAVFIQDANRLLIKDSLEVFREAKRQGAFVFWNHPHWIAQSPNGTAELSETHLQLIREGLIHGIEVVNDLSYSDEALQIALDNNLTIMGSSDIHGLIDWQYRIPEGGHRPVTLVFAREKSEDALKEALVKGRTAVWFDHFLIGKNEFLVPLIQQALKVENAWYTGSYMSKSNVVAVTVWNQSDADYILENVSDYSFYAHGDIVTIKAHDHLVLEVKTLQKLPSFTLKFKVLNAIIAPKTHPDITLQVTITED